MTGFVLGGAILGPKTKSNNPNSPFVKDEKYPDRNWDVVYSSSARAWTIVPDTPRKMVVQRIRWNKSFIRNIFFTGKFYWRRPLLSALYYYFHLLYVFTAPFLITLFAILLLFQGYILLLIACLISIAVLSATMNLVFAPGTRGLFDPAISVLYLFFLPWLLFYSIATIREMKWTRENVEVG